MPEHNPQVVDLTLSDTDEAISETQQAGIIRKNFSVSSGTKKAGPTRRNLPVEIVDEILSYNGMRTSQLKEVPGWGGGWWTPTEERLFQTLVVSHTPAAICPRALNR